MIALRRLVVACLALAGLWLSAAPALAGQVNVAVAANFTEPAKQIAAAFEKKTGHHAALSFGSSGQFYAQISHGAPYQVFLSADADRPIQAEKDGFAVAGTRFTYATGRLVLFSRTLGLVDTRGAVLRAGTFEKLAIADPAAAPYGQAAVETLTKLGLYEGLKLRLVKGASITQAYQFVQTGAAELGFMALSQVIDQKGGSRWLVPANLHRPIEQQAVLLKMGEHDAAARAFLAFLKGPEARAVIRRYGYEVR